MHLLSREDAALLNRLTTDGSAIAASPVAAGDTLVVVTRKAVSTASARLDRYRTLG